MKDRSAILIIFGLSSALALISNWHGIGYTADSCYYLKEAGQLSGKGLWAFLSDHGLPQSLLIILLSGIPENGCRIMSIINILCFSASATLWFCMTKELFTLRSRWLAFGLLMAFNTPMLMGISFLWTEALFFLIFLLVVYSAIRLEKNMNSGNIAILLLSVILLIMARKAGMIVGLAIAIYLIWTILSENKLKWVLTSVLGLLIFAFYGNLGLPNLIGERPSIDFSFQNVLYQMDTIGSWIVPFWATMACVGIIITVIAYLITGKLKGVRLPLVILSCYIFIRLFFEREWAEEHERYLSVIYPLFLVVGIKCFDISHRHKPLKYGSEVILWLIVLYNAVRAIKNVWMWHHVGCML
ncbi:hypothetical protein [Marinoscillum sp. MHG1-6]|uniref:hypothetical protein n=1 Tax=Marinoscillum sp. MHG1-6 TaxID=2959627 RepID=UPI0021580E82|nr:hypothetical protein [Marinoscillum sp. MHG1-6]